MYVLAIVPLRGGSNSIPNKNIKLFAHKPLAYWVLKAAQEAQVIDRIIVPTDSILIKKTIEKFNFDKILVTDRSKKSAMDNAPSEWVLCETARKYQFKDLVFLQATNPFVTSNDIDQAYALYKNKKCDSLLSAVKQKRFYWAKKKNKTSPINYNFKNRPLRQDFEPQYLENGALYITSREKLLKFNNRLSGNIETYLMPYYSYLELDEPEDWNIAEILFRRTSASQNQGDRQ